VGHLVTKPSAFFSVHIFPQLVFLIVYSASIIVDALKGIMLLFTFYSCTFHHILNLTNLFCSVFTSRLCLTSWFWILSLLIHFRNLNCIVCEGKVVPVLKLHTMKMHGGEKVQLHIFLNLVLGGDSSALIFMLYTFLVLKYKETCSSSSSSSSSSSISIIIIYGQWK